MATLIPRAWIAMLMLFVLPQATAELISYFNPCENRVFGKVSHPYSGHLYYSCLFYVPLLRECPPDSLFHEELEACLSDTDDIFPAKPLNALKLSQGQSKGKRCVPMEDVKKLMFYRGHKFNKRTYYLSKDVYTSYDVSTNVCKSLCGYLAEVDNAKERGAIGEMVMSSGNYGVFVAGSDERSHDQWVFPRTGLPVTYKPWYSKQLDHEEKHCLAYIFADNAFDLHEVECVNKNDGIKYACEVE